MSEATSDIPTANDIPSGPIEVGPGESFTNFDEMEAVTAPKREPRREAVKDSPGDAPKTKAKADEKAGDDGGEADETEADDEPAEKSDKKSESKEKSADDKSKEKSARTVKLKNGDIETELSTSAEVPVKVSGKIVNVKLEDLITNYSGHKNWSEQFGKLGEDKAKFTKEREIVVSRLGDMFTTMQKDPIAGLMKMAEMSGQDPMEWRRGFFKDLEPALAKRMEMSEAELRAADAEAELSYYRSEAQSKSEREREESAVKAFETETRNQIKQSGITDSQFEHTYNILERLVQSGEYKPEAGHLTPKDVIKVALTEQAFGHAETELTDVAGDLSPEEKQKFYSEFIPIAVEQKLTPEEIKLVVRDTFGNRKAANLSRKIRKNQTESNKPVRATTSNPMSDALTFDDI